MELCIDQSISAKNAGNKQPSSFGMSVQRNLKKTRKGWWVARLIGHMPLKQALGASSERLVVSRASTERGWLGQGLGLGDCA